METKHIKKLAWVSGNFNFNRINRDNDYNKFANYESRNFTNGDISWLGDAQSLGFDLGVVFKERFSWSIGAEYWLPLGEELSGTYYYEPIGADIENPQSELKVFGISTSLQYYFYNHPKITGELNTLALRVGGSVGFYQASWDLWLEYSNLNLATNTPTITNTTYKDNAPGVSLNLGLDYPVKFYNMVLGIDFGYLYLNFDQVSWYNSIDQEIIASYSGDADGRVDLNLSGFVGKIQVKRFFSW